jgi:nucleoside-diphosphate-sugar epimerase
MDERSMSTILVTGAAGFLGRRLIAGILSGAPSAPQADRIVAADLVRGPMDDPRIDWRVGTIADPDFVRSLVDADTAVVYHLAAVLSGQAEAEFDLGMQINVDGTRGLLEACRHAGRTPRFVMASTVAVFGGALPGLVPEDIALTPQSSYGAEKVICERLVEEYSRRGFVDGIAGRLATVTVRPGRPNSALSSFVSGIIREPLAGAESLCPVPLDTRLWITSPAVVTANLLHASRVPASALGSQRALSLPGLTTTPAELLDSLERLAGPAVRALVRCDVDERISRIVHTWPGALVTTRALGLGFRADDHVDAIVGAFIAESQRAV